MVLLAEKIGDTGLKFGMDTQLDSGINTLPHLFLLVCKAKMPKMVFLGSYVHKPIYICNQLSPGECFKSVHKATLFPMFLSGQTKAEMSTLPKRKTWSYRPNTWYVYTT